MTRRCETCRTPLVRKVYASGPERPGQFAARRFCDMVCRNLKVKPRHSSNHPWLRAGRAMARRLQEKQMLELGH